MDNLKITKLNLENYACFEKALIDLSASSSSTHQWTVFLGNNNTGKTNILKAIAQLSPQELKLPVNKEGRNERFIPSAFFDQTFQNNLRIGANVNARLSDGKEWFYKKGSFKISENSLDRQLLIFGYGVSRYPSSTSLSENKAKPCETLFSTDSRLVNLEEWLMQLDYAAKNDKTKANNKLYRIKELICGNLFPEIKDFTFQSSDDLHNYVLFTTEDGAFRYTQLGYGYQSMLSWIVDLCKRMFDAYPDLENPLEGGAIVLVDEIDLHLHPKWQREIIGYLSDAFPNIQFIVTTHSPLVVQSAKEINLYVLKRQGSKVDIKKAPRSNYSGWTVEEILRETKTCNTAKSKWDVVEEPIVNPLTDTPNDHLYIKGGRFYPKDDKGANTIIAVALNDNDQFVIPRFMEATAVVSHLEEAFESIKDADTIRKITFRLNNIKKIFRQCGPESAYSAFIATYLLYEWPIYHDMEAYLKSKMLWDDELESLKTVIESIALPPV